MTKKENPLLTFGRIFQGATGVTLFGALIIFSTNGRQAIEAVAALPALVAAFSSGLPLGFWSGILGGTVSTGFHLFARSWHKRSFGIELATIVSGLAVVMAQQSGGTPGDVLRALCIGLVAGFAGLFTAKGLRAMFREDPENVKDSTGSAEPVPPLD